MTYFLVQYKLLNIFDNEYLISNYLVFSILNFVACETDSLLTYTKNMRLLEEKNPIKEEPPVPSLLDGTYV